MQKKLLIKSMSYKIGIVILSLFLSGCALLMSNAGDHPLHQMSWQARQNQLNNIKNWAMTGSIGITRGDKSDLGTFYWQQKKPYFIELSGPMSLGKVRIIGDDHKIILQKSAHEQLIANTPEELFFKQFGWKLPISNLVYWIKGLPTPSAIQSLQLDDYNHLVRLKQQGWNVAYSTFKSFAGIDLPTRIYLWNETLQVKLVVKQVNF